MAAKILAVIALAALAGSAMAYPQFWADEYAPDCFSIPVKGKDCHKAPVPDPSTTVTVVPLVDGKVPSNAVARTTYCAGSSYLVQIKFPEARYSYLTLNGGRVGSTNALNKKCPNTMVFSKATGLSTPSAFVTVPVTAPGSGSWTLSIASASGSCAPFRTTTVTLPAKC